MNKHIGDTNKMVSDTPRTDARVRQMIDNDIAPDALESFAKDLERELNAANSIIRQQQLLNEENLRLKQRSERLEEAGDWVAAWICDHKHLIDDINKPLKRWNKAKEAKP